MNKDEQEARATLRSIAWTGATIGMLVASIPALSIMMKTSVFSNRDPNHVVLEYEDVAIDIGSGALEIIVAGAVLGVAIGVLQNRSNNIWTRAFVLSCAVGSGYLTMWISMGLNAFHVFYSAQSIGIWVTASIVVGGGLAAADVLPPAHSRPEEKKRTGEGK